MNEGDEMATVEELQAQIAERDARISQLEVTAPTMFRCPGELKIGETGIEQREHCDFTSPTLAGVCPVHQTHVQ